MSATQSGSATAEHSLQDVPYVADTRAEQLRDAGYDSVEGLAIASIDEVADVHGIGETDAQRIVEGAAVIVNSEPSDAGERTPVEEFEARLYAEGSTGRLWYRDDDGEGIDPRQAPGHEAWLESREDE